jgi:hypothetical protein
VVHRTLTLPKRHAQFTVDSSEKRSPDKRKKARRSDTSQGTKGLHDWHAEVPTRLDVRRHKSVAGVLMSRMHMMLTPVAQSGSGAPRLRSGGNECWAVRVHHGDIKQLGTSALQAEHACAV